MKLLGHDIVWELPPTLVARALGYSAQVIHLHAADAAVPMAGYPAIILVDPKNSADQLDAEAKSGHVVGNSQSRIQGEHHGHPPR